LNVATHQVAQSVPQRFYHGPDSIVAPHLPIGSPERAELFAGLRKTFCEDWDAAERSVAAARAAKGDLYFIRCGNAVKIGHTANIVQRLANMQVNTPHELDCLLLLKGQGHEERQWHERFRADQIRGEWFRWTVELERAVLDARETQRSMA
jgi:hypothetical protein